METAILYRTLGTILGIDWDTGKENGNYQI